MPRLKNKTAVITGGAGDIGRSITALFLKEGAEVLLVDRDEAALTESRSVIDSDCLHVCVADVATEEGVQCYCRIAADLFGELNIMILNAGLVGPIANIVDYPTDAFDSVIAVNVRGVWLGLKHAIPIMIDGGSIILCSSISGVRSATQMSAYGASKHAVLGLARCAAMECAERGIRVNAIGPGPINSRMMHKIETGHNANAPADARAFIASRIPLGRYGRPDEVAEMALFLASDSSSYCTGSMFMMDGGLTAK